MAFKKVSNVNKLKLIANEIRIDIIRMLVSAGSGHSAGPLGMADVFTALYFNAMNHNPKNPKWADRDRFVLSNGHICPVWYATLAKAGYFPQKEIMTLRKLGTRLHGHPHNLALPGIENSAGPLGQGISVAVGIALGAKLDKKKYTVYCGMSDGELEEGQPWEAFMFAAKNNLDNLIAIDDRNYIQIDGDTRNIMPLDPLDKKMRAFNWNVIVIDREINNEKSIRHKTLTNYLNILNVRKNIGALDPYCEEKPIKSDKRLFITERKHKGKKIIVIVNVSDDKVYLKKYKNKVNLLSKIRFDGQVEPYGVYIIVS